MLAFGILSLLSLGLVGMATGGGDDDDDDMIQNAQSGVDLDEEYSITYGPVGIDFEAGEGLDPDVESQINDFVAGVEADPNRPIEDVVNELHAFLDDLEEDTDQTEILGDDFNFTPASDTDPAIVAEVNDLLEELRLEPGLSALGAATQLNDLIDRLEDEAEDAPATDSADATDTVAATAEATFSPPPEVEYYRDPLLRAEELDAQRILAEIAAEEARTPVNLVTVSNSSNSEVSDDVVLSATEDGNDAVDATFTVTAPEGANDIDVRYDAIHTFQVEYTAGTDSVTVGLNSDVNGPVGTVNWDLTSETDADGSEIVTRVWTKEFESSTDITLNVESHHIGTHFSLIDLSNPDDTLHIEFGDGIDGNLHLITEEAEEAYEGDTRTTVRAYVISTPENLTAVSQSAINAFNETDNGQILDGIILAEIYLGEDSLSTVGDSLGTVDFQQQILNFINDNPQITTNVTWTSTGAPTTDTGNTVTDNNSSSGGGDLGMATMPFSISSFLGS